MLFKLVSRYKIALNRRLYCTGSVNNNKLYSSTVFLPKTKFPLRLENNKLLERDESIISVAEFDHLYKWQRSHLSEPEFVLHDGPPYANGKLHMGHALNKILKDTILRYQILKGNKVHYVPGWDCHGLPIELKALSKVDATPLEIREKARNFAKNTISEQKEVFKSWGILGDWNKHYATYNTDYVKLQLKIFNKMYQKNLIYRDVKPIYWSPSSKTALAEAELEYNENHVSKSAYVRFKVKNFPKDNNDKVFALIWTTTPWTLPANQAVCYNPTLSYVLAKSTKDDCCYIVAEETIGKLSDAFGFTLEKIGAIPSELLSQCTYIHPVYKDRELRFLAGAHVTASKGTGLVHTAPAHGPDDFLIALNNKIKIVNLVNELGCYNSEAGLDLVDKFVLNEGTDKVLEKIQNDIVHLHDFKHSYAYDWRTKKPVIMKTSQQWFVDTESIKGRAIELLENISVVPKVNSEIYKRNFVNQIQNRPYWCISRQRKWGVPIPVFYNKLDGSIIISEDLIRHFNTLIDNHGTDFWWQLPLKQLIPEELRNNVPLENIEKSQDILDIWFDSGISWANALEGAKVADMYLEGVDQFTGWFQSSLLTSVAVRDKAPYKSIYVHGFVVDDDGLKMSKSLGNVIDPIEIVKGGKKKKPFGVDTLRWWVACHANKDSLAHISTNVLQACSDELQKIRSVLRFALGGLSDFNNDSIDYERLTLLDKYILHLLHQFHSQGKDSISNYQFHQICKSVINLLTNQVSALYYSAIKDRLYCDQLDAISRRSTQFVLLQIFHTITQSIAPMVPHLAEELYQNLPQKSGKTFFTSTQSLPEDCWKNDTVEKAINVILEMKKDVNKQVGASTQNSSIHVIISKNFQKLLGKTIELNELEQELEDIFQVSLVTIETSELQDDYKLEITKSKLFSCARCRRVQSKEENELCERCTNVVNNLNVQKAVI